MPQRNLTKGHNLAPSLMNITPQYSPTAIYKPTKGARRRKKGERAHPQNHTFSVLVQVNYPLMTFLLCKYL